MIEDKELKELISNAAKQVAETIKNDKATFPIEDKRWHLDKKVPLAIIFALVLQTVGAIWWAAQIDNRVSAIEGWVKTNNTVASKLAVIEEGQRWIKLILGEIKDKVK